MTPPAKHATMSEMLKRSLDKAHNDFDYLLVSLDVSHVLKQPYLFNNRICIFAGLVDMVSRDIDAGAVLAERDLLRSSGRVFEEVLERVEKFTLSGGGMHAADITQDEFNDAHERLIVNIKKLIKYNRRMTHVRAMKLRKSS